MDHGSRDNERRRMPAQPPLRRDEIERSVRSIAQVLLRLHQLCMTRLCHDNDIELAEELNDALKPAIDFLLHFELEGEH